MIARGPEAVALVAGALAVAMWGAVPVGTRFLVDGEAQRIGPLALVGLRFGLSALVLLPALLRARPWGWPGADLRLAVLASALGVIGYNLPVALGQVSASAGVTALVIATEPLWILLLWSLKRRQMPGRAQGAGALLALVGIACLAVPGLVGMGPGASKGLSWVVLGAFCWSAYCVVVVPLVQRHGALSVTATTVALGALPLLSLAAPDLSRMEGLAGADLALIALLALGSTVLATLAWNLAVARLPGPGSGQLLFAIPVVGLLAGHFLLGEALTARSWIAFGCIGWGLWLGQRRPEA